MSGTANPGEWTLRQAAVSGVKWTGAAQLARQFVQVATSLVMMRLLGPDPAGVIALAQTLVNFAQLFRETGTTPALIQRREISAPLVSSLSWLNGALGLLVAAALAALASPLARVSGEPRLAGVLVALAAGIVLAGLAVVPQALLERGMRFRAVAVVEMLATGAGAAAGIGGALAGWSHWSFVAQVLAHAIVTTAGVHAASRHRPGATFDVAEIRGIAGVSLPFAAYSFLNYLQRNADNLIVQNALGTAALGLYARAYQTLLVPLLQVWSVIARVAQPALARVADQPPRFRTTYLSFTGAVAAASFPTCLGLAAVAPEFVEGILGPAWTPIIPLVRIFGLMGTVQSVTTLSGTAFLALGRSDVLLRLGLWTTPVLLLSFVIGVRSGIVGVAACYSVAIAFTAIPVLAAVTRLVGLRATDYWTTLRRPLAASVIMAACVAATGLLLPAAWPALPRLALLVAEGVALYAALAWTLDREQVRNIASLLRA